MSKLCPVCGTTYLDALVFCPADGTTLRAGDLSGDLVGSVVADRYLVTDLLGEGGMGTVYLARHVRLPQQAAIKVLRKDMLRDAAAVARFNREAANASRIDHDRVARVYDFGETDDGTVYLAMEYVQGKTLKQLLNDGGPMAPARAAGLVRQIAEGLDAAHRMGIVHRDLKPDNILVIDDGDGGERVKVVDFGIAKAFGGDEGGRGLTRTGMVVGTPEFMSPEQLLGESLDARSDIYALAIVAYQCLTGDLPFSTNTPDHGMTARLMTPPRPLLAVRPSVQWPDAVQHVFDEGLAREPQNRPSTAGTFARSLARALDEWLNATGATGVRARTSTPPVSMPAPYVPPSLAIPPIVAQPPAGAGTAGTLTRPPNRMPLIVGSIVAVVVLGGAGVLLTRSRGAGAITPVSTAPVGDTTAAARPGATTASVAATPTTPPPNVTVPNIPVPNAVAPNATTPNAVTPNAPTSSAAVPVSRPAVDPPGGGSTAPAAAARALLSTAAAKQTLDSIAKVLDPATASETTERAALRTLSALMPRLSNASDSTWATIRMVEANALLGDMAAACRNARAASSIARSGDQRDAANRFIHDLSC